MIDIGWKETHVLAFNQDKMSLFNAVELSHREPAKIICVHTDPSDRLWSGIVTQCDTTMLEKPKLEQNHQPQAFPEAIFSQPGIVELPIGKRRILYKNDQTTQLHDYVRSGRPHINGLQKTPLHVSPVIGRAI